MIDFGYTLRQARESKGMTTRQIADSTHMMEQMVIDLENEEFGRIAAPIYGRGFVKLYCEAVGIDPKPLIAEFMEIFNGNRPATIRRRPEAAPVQAPAPVAQPPAPAPVAQPPAPEPVAETPSEPAFTLESLPAESGADEADDGIIPAASEPQPPVTAAEPPQPQDPLFAFAQEPEPPPAPRAAPAHVAPPAPPLARGPSRYAAPTPIDDEPGRPGIAIPPAFWRLLAIVGAALLLLWLVCAGLHALYAALTAAPTAQPDTGDATAQPAAVTAPATPQAPDTSAPAPRKHMDIPPLYID